MDSYTESYTSNEPSWDYCPDCLHPMEVICRRCNRPTPVKIDKIIERIEDEFGANDKRKHRTDQRGSGAVK